MRRDIGIVVIPLHDRAGQRRRRAEAVMGAQSGANRVGADARGRAVVA
jgi:hypothetical protein